RAALLLFEGLFRLPRHRRRILCAAGCRKRVGNGRRECAAFPTAGGQQRPARILRVSRVAAALLLLLAASGAGAVTLTILHTSDLHGHVHPHDSLADKDLGEGLARVAAAVKAIRAESNPVLLVDSGDTIEGAPEQALAFAGQVGKGVGSDPI